MRILPSRRAGFHYLEHCRVHMLGERVVYSTSQDALTRHWNIPTINTSAILLGTGTSLTNAAARRLAEERVLVAFTGSGGTPIFMGSLSEYAPTERLQSWIAVWPDPARRLVMAKFLAAERCRMVNKSWASLEVGQSPNGLTEQFLARVADAPSVEALRGAEGEFAKSLYKLAAQATGIEWSGRVTRPEDEQDLANRFLDQGNYIAYGLAGVVLWSLGMPPGLAVSHGATRAGGLVFDLADVIKDAIVLPHAFRGAAQGLRAQVFRDKLVDAMDAMQVLPFLFETFDKALEAGRQGFVP